MQPRMAYDKASPGALKAMSRLEAYVQQRGIEQNLMDLIKTRAAQIKRAAALSAQRMARAADLLRTRLRGTGMD